MAEFKPVIVPEDMVPALYAEIASLQAEVARLSARNKELEAALAKTDGATPAPRTDFYKW